MTTAIDVPPKPGEVVRVRSQRYLVEDVEPAPAPGEQTLVRLSCLEDDAEGEEVQVLWEKEVDAQRINEADWSRLATGEFDRPHLFAAYYRMLRWNAVTSDSSCQDEAVLQVYRVAVAPRRTLVVPRIATSRCATTDAISASASN